MLIDLQVVDLCQQAITDVAEAKDHVKNTPQNKNLNCRVLSHTSHASLLECRVGVVAAAVSCLPKTCLVVYFASEEVCFIRNNEMCG